MCRAAIAVVVAGLVAVSSWGQGAGHNLNFNSSAVPGFAALPAEHVHAFVESVNLSAFIQRAVATNVFMRDVYVVSEDSALEHSLLGLFGDSIAKRGYLLLPSAGSGGLGDLLVAVGVARVTSLIPGYEPSLVTIGVRVFVYPGRTASNAAVQENLRWSGNFSIFESVLEERPAAFVSGIVGRIGQTHDSGDDAW